MKITIDRKAFLRAWGLVAPLAPERTPKPILTNVKVQASPEGEVILTATDLDLSVRAVAPVLSIRGTGSALLPAKRVSQILGSMADAQVEIAIDDEKVTIEGPQAKFKIATDNPDDFPIFPEIKAENSITVKQADLRRLIRRVIFAADLESTKFALGGALVEVEDGRLALVCTDGRRLSKASAPAEYDAGVDLSKKPVLSAHGLRLVDRMLGDKGDDTVSLTIDSNRWAVASYDAEVSGRLVEGRFPNYGQIFPADTPVKAKASVSALIDATTLASITTSAESCGVTFSFGTSGLTLRSEASDAGSSSVDVECEYGDEPMDVVVNPKYLLDPLKAAGEGEAVIALIGPKSPVVVSIGDDYQSVIMPLTKN